MYGPFFDVSSLLILYARGVFPSIRSEITGKIGSWICVFGNGIRKFCYIQARLNVNGEPRYAQLDVGGSFGG